MNHMLWGSGAGAFGILLYITTPFLAAYLLILFWVLKRGVQVSEKKSLVRAEFTWILLVGVIWAAINIVSFSWIPGGVGQPLIPPELGGGQVVEIDAFMWGYNISDQEVRAGETVRFIMKTLDTIHSVGIYDPEGNVITTVMLMPGMKEQIVLKLEPGTYTIRCLEFCGPGHSFMSAQIQVVG